MGSQLPLKGAQLLIFSSCLVSPDGVASSWMVSVSASVNLPLLISPCTVKSRSSLLAPVHPGGPGKRAVKPLCVYCGQTAGWMKTPLGTEADLGPGHIVFVSFGSVVSSLDEPFLVTGDHSYELLPCQK